MIGAQKNLILTNFCVLEGDCSLCSPVFTGMINRLTVYPSAVFFNREEIKQVNKIEVEVKNI